MLFAELMWLSVSDSYRWGKDGLCGRSMVCRRLNFFNCLRKSILWVVFSFTRWLPPTWGAVKLWVLSTWSCVKVKMVLKGHCNGSSSDTVWRTAFKGSFFAVAHEASQHCVFEEPYGGRHVLFQCYATRNIPCSVQVELNWQHLWHNLIAIKGIKVDCHKS